MIDGFIGHTLTPGQPGCPKSEVPLADRKRAHYAANAESYRAKERTRYHRRNTERDLERIAAWKADNPDRVARSRLLKNAKVRAGALGLPFNLTLADIEIPEVCPVLGIQIVFGRGQVQSGSPTLDRVLPEKGYVRGNVAVISHRANQIKSNGTVEEHEAVLRYMRSRA